MPEIPNQNKKHSRIESSTVSVSQLLTSGRKIKKTHQVIFLFARGRDDMIMDNKKCKFYRIEFISK